MASDPDDAAADLEADSEERKVLDEDRAHKHNDVVVYKSRM
jgi:hypothetical protein